MRKFCRDAGFAGSGFASCGVYTGMFLLSLALGLQLAVRVGAEPEAATANASAAETPLVMLTEYNPWAMAVGSDTPQFVVYGDGRVIYWHRLEKGGEYRTVQLSASEVDTLTGRLAVQDLASAALEYSLSNWTDQPTLVLQVHTGGIDKRISVYGSVGDVSADKTKLPKALRDDLVALDKYSNDEAVPWHPEQIEVLVWPFEYARGRVIEWPSGWPGIEDAATIRHRHGTYALFLPYSDFPQLERLMKVARQNRAFEISGHKWTCSPRFPFPHEMAAYRQRRAAAAAQLGQLHSFSAAEAAQHVVVQQTAKQPEYEQDLGEAGVVTVRVVVDKTGAVVEEDAIGDGEMNWEAAEVAAKGYRFSPFLVDGQPVMVQTEIRVPVGKVADEKK